MLQEIDTGVYIENYGISNNLLYADDICIYGFSACALTRMLQTCQEWATKHGDFEFSAEKSFFMIFSKKKAYRDEKIEIKLNNEIIKKVNSTKYLGTILSSDLTMNEDINEKRGILYYNANSIRTEILAKTSHTVKKIFFYSKRTIYNFSFHNLKPSDKLFTGLSKAYRFLYC
jgi:hypothetical protein